MRSIVSETNKKLNVEKIGVNYLLRIFKKLRSS